MNTSGVSTSPPTAPIALADALFGKTKQAAIALLFSRPGQALHLRELARLAAVSLAMMAKEMTVLLRAGLVEEERDGNRRLFRANAASPVFEELASIARKTAGVADVLRAALAGVAGIRLAFVFGSVASGQAHAGSDIDLWVVGDCDYAALLGACARAGEQLGRPVNPVLYAPQELAARVAEDNAFVAQVRQRPRIELTGSGDDIALALGGAAGQGPAA